MLPVWFLFADLETKDIKLDFKYSIAADKTEIPNLINFLHNNHLIWSRIDSHHFI